MFMGEYNHTIDAKGRLIIPAKFREPLGEEFVLTRGLEGCLYIYPMDEWEAFEEKLRALPLTNKDARAFSRFFVAARITSFSRPANSRNVCGTRILPCLSSSQG